MILSLRFILFFEKNKEKQSIDRRDFWHVLLPNPTMSQFIHFLFGIHIYSEIIQN